MAAIDVEPNADLGLRTPQGVAPVSAPAPTDGGEAIWGAAFRQTNSVVSAMQYLRNSGHYAPEDGYNPVDDIKAWKEPKYMLDHGNSFVGSRSRAETMAIRDQIDTEEKDKATLAANGGAGLMAGMAAGLLDPTILLPAGVAIDASKGGLSFVKAAKNVGIAGLMQSTAQEALLQSTQETRTLDESAMNIATATMLSAMIGGGAAALLSRGERAAIETALHADRADINAHAENPVSPEAVPNAAGNITENITAPANENLPASTGQAASVGAAASDTRQIDLVETPLNRILAPTSPTHRVFAAQSLSGRRAMADLAETALLTKENLEGGTTTFNGGPSLEREAKLHIAQTQVSVGDELTRLFSEYRYGEQKTLVRQRAGFEDLTGRGEPGKMSYADFKEEISDALRNNDTHEIPQVQAAAQAIRKQVFDPWLKRAQEAGMIGEDVDVKTAQSYFQRVYNKQAIAAQRPAFVEKVTDWLHADQTAKAQAKERIGLYQGSMDIANDQIETLTRRIETLSADVEVVQARAEEATRMNKAAFQRAETLRTGERPKENARGGAVFETKARNRGNDLQDRAAAKLAEIETLELKLASEIQNAESMRGKIEGEIAKWEGKSVSEAKSGLKAREAAEKLREERKAAKGDESASDRLTSADKAIDKAVRRILKSDRDLSRDELRSRSQEITDRILGSPDGRLPYDIAQGGPESGVPTGGEAPRGPLASREFNIPDATIREFLDNDAEHVVAQHLRTVVPDVLLTERFGDTRMTESFRKVNDDYAALVDAAKSEKERTALRKEQEGVIRDIAAVRDRIRGTFGISSDAPLRNAARVAGFVKNYNVLTSMGSAALTSLPDMAGVVMRHGLTNTFRDAWAPFFRFLTSDSDAWKEAGRQYRAMGIAVEGTLAARHHAISDTLDSYHPQSRAERAMQWATNRFQFVNMLAPWTDFAKVNASMVVSSEILRAAEASVKGTASSRQLRNLGESGINPRMAERIFDAFGTGGEVRDGVHLPNTADWADIEARRVFEGAVARDADISVITPGQEKPLWMSHPLMSVLGQFKSFTAAATERTLLANLQRRDAAVLQGIMFSMGLGMLSYKLNSLTGGSPTSERPQDWVKESISRAGLLGWFEEGNALASKATGGGVDIYRMIGANKPLSRFASRTASDQLLGPTKGKIDQIIGVARAAANPSEWGESDTKAIRRLVAGQNVFWLRRALDEVEKSTNNAFGIEMKAKPENR